jgi:hypothetical protein
MMLHRRSRHAAARWCRAGLDAAALAAVLFVGVASIAAAAEDAWHAELARRLSALAPGRPAEYVELAEDVMDHAPTSGSADADRELGRHLAALAGAVDVRGSGRSAALFLAEHAASDAERGRMLALAALLDPGSDMRVEAAERSDAVLSLVRAFALYRRGDGIHAKEALARPGAAALLDRHPEILKGGSARFRADCDAMRTGGPPAVSPAQVDALHLLAASAIAGAPRSWGESLARVGAVPLPEVDLNDPRALFGVDPAECAWVNGRWARPPAGP